MRLVLGPFGHPPLEDFFLRGTQNLLQARRRHHFFGVVGVDPVEDCSRIHIARHNGPVLDGILAAIQTQVGLATGAIGPVTSETVLDQNRPDVPVKAEQYTRSTRCHRG